MNEVIRFGSRDYFLMALLLVFARSMDFLSTWIATPNLVLEGNPIAKKLGWRLGAAVNAALCLGMAFWPVTAIAISTTSMLVAARNFQAAWLMRTMGEENYRDWHVARIQETPITLYLLCLAGNTLLPAGVGIALIFLSNGLMVPVSIGLGTITYSVAVAFYSLLAVWRLRRNSRRKAVPVESAPIIIVNGASLKSTLADSCACETSDYPGK
jgi:hypothetical protein